MPRPRRHRDNAARQKAYRERVKTREIKPASMVGIGTPGANALVDRVVAADAAAKARDA